MAVVGAGKVGSALAKALARAGWPVVAVACRTAASARRASRFTGAPAMSAGEAAARGRLVLMAVPDDLVSVAAREIAPRVQRGAVVAHTSGVLSSDALAPVRRRGARAASLHPLMTMPSPAAGAASLPGTRFFHEGDRGTAPVLRAMVRALGGIPIAVSRGGKALYHAGAVLACNDLVALLDAAFRLFGRAGVPGRRARAALAPLVRRTVENVLALGAARALTGPVARGDAGTVARHLAVLRGRPRELYLALGRATLDLARLPRPRRAALARLLENRP